MLITLVPPRKRKDEVEKLEIVEQSVLEKRNEETVRALNIFFWILVLILVTMIVLRYTVLKPVM
jgi:hypothetical protein